MPILRIAKSLAKKVLRRNSSNTSNTSDSKWTSEDTSYSEPKPPVKKQADAKLGTDTTTADTPIVQEEKKAASDIQVDATPPDKVKRVLKTEVEPKKPAPEEATKESIQAEAVLKEEKKSKRKSKKATDSSDDVKTSEENKQEIKTEPEETELKKEDVKEPEELKAEPEQAETEGEQAIYSFTAHGIIPETCPSCGASSHNNWERDGQDFVCGSCEEPYT